VGKPYAEVALGHGLATPAEVWEPAFRRAWKAMPELEPTPDGGPFPDDQRGWWAALVHLVVQDLRLGLSPAAEAALFADLWEHFTLPGVWRAYPEVHDVLGTLREVGLKLVIISNFDQRLYPVLKHEGLDAYFDAVYLSSVHGADKPHPRMFQRFLADTGLTATPDLALHIGDHPKADWAAARNAGLHAFELDRAKGRTLEDVLAIITSLE
jgi:putative hydrolase of the HAD superfamily